MLRDLQLDSARGGHCKPAELVALLPLAEKIRLHVWNCGAYAALAVNKMRRTRPLFPAAGVRKIRFASTRFSP